MYVVYTMVALRDTPRGRRFTKNLSSFHRGGNSRQVPGTFWTLPAITGSSTDGVREFPLVRKPVAISVGVGGEPQTGSLAETRY